jgi:hypothetical protein
MLPSLTEVAAGYTSLGLGAALTSFSEFLVKARARQSATFNDGVVKCKVPDSAGIWRAECRLVAETTSTMRKAGPVAALQRATDALLNQIPLYQLAGQTLEVRLPDGGSRPVFIEEFPEDAINTIGGGYDGIVGAGVMQFASPAMLLAASLKTPPPSVVPAFTSPTAMTFTKYSAAIAAYFAEISDNFDQLLADFKARGGKPAATPLIPETVVIPPGFRPPKKKKRYAALVVAASFATAGLVGLGASALAAREKGIPLLPEEMF